jgi:hypothetical protein
MPIAGTVPLSGLIAPSSTSDTYPVTDPQYGLGGLRTVADTTARNDIPMSRRQQGMLVYVTATSQYFALVGGTGNQNWIEFSGDSGYFAIANPQDGDVLIYANAASAFANNPKETLTDGGTF